MSPSLHLPPAKPSVYAVSASSIIDAPLDKVWSIVLDFSSYKHWNPFVRNQIVTDASGQALASQVPHAGQYLSIGPVHIPPRLTDDAPFHQRQSAFCLITTLDHHEHLVSWCTAGFLPHWVLHAERWQGLSVDAETGRTLYETREVFNGLAAYIVKYVVGRNLKLGFEAQALGLKMFAES